MQNLELAFASKEDSLSVRRFSVHEALSELFEVAIWARSPSDEIDLESIVGKPASFRMITGLSFSHAPFRMWTGVCSHMELVQAEPTGLSTYFLRIVPTMWLLTQRRNHRIFQHETIPDIVQKVLEDWRIKPVLKIDKAAYPKQEYRVQYGETDFAFVRRMLEQAGITFYFAFDPEKGTTDLVLSDKPHEADPRPGGPVPYVDNPNVEAEREYVTHVRVAHIVKPGRLVLRDFDFRRKPDFQLFGEGAPAKAPEDFYEQYHYAPGSFWIEVDKASSGSQGAGPSKGGDTPVADDQAVARADDKEGRRRAQRELEALRVGKRHVDFDCNLADLAPGVVFSIDRHPRKDLAKDKKLLVTEYTIEGTPTGEWSFSGEAVFAAHPYRPPIRTPKPRIHGVQSAIVVGPKGEEIHTDEFGRVRVQFHWDRHGKYDDHSSCWMRVSQGWAGAGFGMITIPRVGQEVLVGFLEGDPDQPVVVGRVYNNTTRVPYPLPDHKTKSTWKSDSSPSSNGFNEIMFEDKKGQELVYIQAQRNLQKLVKANETERTGQNRTIHVGQNRTIVVGAVDATLVGQKQSVQIAQAKDPPPTTPPTGYEMSDKKLKLTTGEATVVFDGKDITFEAKGNITIKSLGGDVIIEGGPNVKINCP